jgi:hypothetical protein
MRRLGSGIWACLLAAGIGSAAALPARADDLKAWVAAKAGALELMHRKAERALIGVAQDPSYRQYFLQTSNEDERAKLKDRIDQISLESQRKFHVGEMCLINAHGHEISRIVEGAIANNLSTTESQNIFFAPGFAEQARSAYVSPIYISPDVHRWVIGYVTPIEVSGNKKAILHYEHDLSSYQELLRQGISGDRRYLLAVTPDGWIIADSRREISTAQRGESTAPADYFEPFAVEGQSLQQIEAAFGGGERGHGTVELNGQRYGIAWQTVKRWTLVGLEELDQAEAAGGGSSR